MENRLYTHYSIDEVVNMKTITKKLEILEKEGKISWEIEDDILTIEDFDLDENEVEMLVKLFDKNEAYPFFDSLYLENDSNIFDDFDDDEDDDYGNYGRNGGGGGDDGSTDYDF
jgi:hypothetical protein